ncbi:hypothetical protein ES703_59599 [subsurface metagenome]
MKNGSSEKVKKRLINIHELSAYTGFSSSALYSMVSQKRIPYVKIGHSIRFDLQKIDEFIRKHSFEVNKVWE